MQPTTSKSSPAQPTTDRQKLGPGAKEQPARNVPALLQSKPTLADDRLFLASRCPQRALAHARPVEKRDL